MKVKLKENLKEEDFNIKLPNGATYKVNKLLNLQGNVRRFYMFIYDNGINDYQSKPYFKAFQNKINELYYIDLEYK